MRMYSCLICALVALISCIQKNEGSSTGTNQDPAFIDTIQSNDPKNNLSIQAKLMVQVDSSDVIMFPLSMQEKDMGGKKSSYKDLPYNAYWNIIFYNSSASQYYLLSDRKMMVTDYFTGAQQYENQTQYHPQYIFYKVIIEDYNQDKILDDHDPEYLFITDRKGKHFRQISPPGYKILSWQYIKASDKVFMIVTKDNDHNKKFEDWEEVTSFAIAIDRDTLPTEIFPGEFKNQLKALYDRDWKKIRR